MDMEKREMERGGDGDRRDDERGNGELDVDMEKREMERGESPDLGNSTKSMKFIII